LKRGKKGQSCMLRPFLAWLDTPRGSVISGAFASIALTLFAVAVGALVFGAYGWVLFLIAPFFIGLAGGYLLNRRVDIGAGNSALSVFGLLVLAGIALIFTALEGLMCLVMASPLEIPLTILGGLAGRRWALAVDGGSTANAFVGFAVLPVFFAAEQLVIGANAFEISTSIDIDASQAQVWSALIGMANIDEKPSLPFRLGVSYPIGAKMVGEGVDAIRFGRFSTGTALERVAAWEPTRELALQILSEPAGMRELSLYEHVHAPHVLGYFNTRLVRFLMTPLPGGARLEIASTHELKLEPRAYWMPLASWIVKENGDRVLRHIKREAEHLRLKTAAY
jgi:hypothetical protein